MAKTTPLPLLRTPTASAALSVELRPGEREYVLIPDGEFRAEDGSGRPAEVPAWRNNAEIAARVIARAQRQAARMVVDYEHQTLQLAEGSDAAPASGWIDRGSLRYEPGVGIVGVIDWTPRAAQMIAGHEYAYLSPVFLYSPVSGEVLLLQHVGLTNRPALNLPQVALRADDWMDFSTEEVPQVNETLKKLLASLGLAEAASEAEALSAVAALKAQAGQVTDLQGQVAALSAQAPDPSRFVAVETMQALQGQVAALTAQVHGEKVSQVVEAALSAGKLLPAQKEWAQELGRTNLAALSSYLDKTPAIAALAGTQTGGEAPAGAAQQAVCSADEMKICGQLGVSVADYQQAKGV